MQESSGESDVVDIAGMPWEGTVDWAYDGQKKF
jgi:hypothetical protein